MISRSACSRAVVLAVAMLALAQAPEGKRISVYTAQTGFSLPVVDRNGSEYVGFFEVLEPIGPVSTRIDKKRWRLKFGEKEAEFEDGKSRAKVDGSGVDLGNRFVLENGRGWVPVGSLPNLVRALTGASAELHMPARRLFVGATPVRYNAQVQKGATSRLVLTFSSPVNPFVATEHGTVRLVFAREPVVSSGNDAQALGDALFSSANYAESNGAAELTVRVTAPVIASFSDANRTITLTPVQAPQTAQTSSASSEQSAQSAAPPQASGSPAARRPPYFILIDPAHGGSDRGAALNPALAEKDAVLTIARRLRAEFEAKGVPVRLLREGDVELPPDRRGAAVNTSHAAAVIFVHASTVGNGVHISTAALVPSNGNNVANWERAQSRTLDASRHWADAVAGEVLKRNIAVLRLRASVPPLNETAVPAFVLEVTPPPAGASDSLLAGSYLQAVTSSIASATAAERDRLAQGAR